MTIGHIQIAAIAHLLMPEAGADVGAVASGAKRSPVGAEEMELFLAELAVQLLAA